MLWIDADGDGIRDEGSGPCNDVDEVECTVDPFSEIPENSWERPSQAELDNPAPPAGGRTVSIDDDGNIWLLFETANWVLKRQGMTSAGAPEYALAIDGSNPPRSIWSLPSTTPAITRAADVHYDSVADVMYLLGEYASGSPAVPKFLLARYTGWFGSRTQTYATPLPSPYDSPEFLCHPSIGECAVGAVYMDLEVSGSKVFLAERFGPVHVRQAATGAAVTRLFAGPEVSGQQVYNFEGVRTAQRSDGEYLIAPSDVAIRGRTLVYRYRESCTDDEDCPAGEVCVVGSCRPRACDPDGEFGTISSVFSSSLTADGLSLSADELTAYVSRKDSTHYDLYVTTRASKDAAFGSLTALANVNSSADDRAPWISDDGLRLYFWTKNTSNGNGNLVLSTRASTADAFSSPSAVPGANVNSDASDEDPFLFAGESRLFFTSDRPSGDRDLWSLTRDGSSFVNPTKLAVVNTAAEFEEERRPILTPDGLTLYFHSDRLGFDADTDGDIWIAHRDSLGEHFDSPALVAGLNGAGREFPVALSKDSCTLYFASNRDTGGGGTQSFRLYQATRAAPE